MLCLLLVGTLQSQVNVVFITDGKSDGNDA